MEKEIISAIIQGLATLIGAGVGAYVLMRSIKRTTNDAITLHKADKLAEAKRDIFLSFVDCWINYLLVINSFRVNLKDDYFKMVFQANRDLVSSLHKSSFISDSETRKAIMDFTFHQTEQNIKLTQITIDWFSESGNKNEILSNVMIIAGDLGDRAIILQDLLRNELGIKSDSNIDACINKRQEQFASKMKDFIHL